jgi:hypothetical protein
MRTPSHLTSASVRAVETSDLGVAAKEFATVVRDAVDNLEAQAAAVAEGLTTQDLHVRYAIADVAVSHSVDVRDGATLVSVVAVGRLTLHQTRVYEDDC